MEDMNATQTGLSFKATTTQKQREAAAKAQATRRAKQLARWARAEADAARLVAISEGIESGHGALAERDDPMICPACESLIDPKNYQAAKRRINAAVKAAQVKTGSQGGKAGTGAAKRRNVNYAELGRMGAEARRKAREA